MKPLQVCLLQGNLLDCSRNIVGELLCMVYLTLLKCELAFKKKKVQFIQLCLCKLANNDNRYIPFLPWPCLLSEEDLERVTQWRVTDLVPHLCSFISEQYKESSPVFNELCSQLITVSNPAMGSSVIHLQSEAGVCETTGKRALNKVRYFCLSQFVTMTWVRTLSTLEQYCRKSAQWIFFCICILLNEQHLNDIMASSNNQARSKVNVSN